MKKLKEYSIPFVGLKLGKHVFEFEIDNTFFELYNYDEFGEVSIVAEVVLEKKSNMLELDFAHKGTVNVPCDITNEEFDLAVEGKMKLIVRFGEAFDDTDDEMLILPLDSFEINVAQYIYEMIVLSVPQKRIHPDAEKGVQETENLTELGDEEGDEENTEWEETDPRWDKLKELLKDK